ncbi:hypothetical protein [Flavobacterium sp. HJJ]|uniref:hypothetical protein n=1 Tax=Flavobacterium sp. HJJ TaxID=2783792 RepID=UPI00188A4A46|nr:hypothetical protein [Flavobacterium sp. HJJ]MBF4473052.1 hypothetical protein [Flavobacterium sp. HJJ]
MKNNSTDITNWVSEELTTRSFSLEKDIFEFGIDHFMKDGIIKDIPFMGIITSFYNIGSSILARRNVKKIITFFQEFNSGEIDDTKFNQFLYKFNSDNKYRDEIVETILVLNERFLQIEKSKILANLVLAHINDNLSWAEFSDLSYILDNIHPKCFFLLKEMSNQPYWRSTIIQSPPDEALIIASGIGLREGSNFVIVELGQKLYKFGIGPSNI